MKLAMRSFRPLFLALVTVSVFLGSCKKHKADDSDNARLNPAVPATTDRTLQTRDSIYLYALHTYYWNTSLPSYADFNPRRYNSNDDEVFALTTFSLNPATGKNYEYVAGASYPKYSFIDDGSVASELGGTGGDYGFSVFYNSENDLRIKYVYAASDAAAKGLKRGYRITKLNGRTDLNGSVSANIDFISNAVFGSNANISMTLLKPDGSSVDVTVSKTSYAIDPVIYSTVFTAGSKKVGYFVFNSFTTNAETRLKNLMAGFASQNVSELVVDLRYNGGGSVQTSELLANLIAPSAATGSTMYDTYFNADMQNGRATILKNQKFKDNGVTHSYDEFDYSVAGNNVKFAKSGALNVSRVYFIVTGSTASASELLINNLKPVVDVKLIGRKTYGKPVGFFALRIDKYDLYIPQFETKNKLNAGGYYSGISVDKDDTDDVTKEFGDPTEKLLSYALNYANKGIFSVANTGDKINAAGTDRLSSVESDLLTDQLDAGQFKGMVSEKLKFKK